MKRIKKVTVTMERYGKKHVMGVFKSIKAAQEYMEAYGQRVYEYCYQFNAGKTSADHFATIYRKRGHGGMAMEFVKDEDFWHTSRKYVIGFLEINVIR